jgi:hypothetical protein
VTCPLREGQVIAVAAADQGGKLIQFSRNWGPLKLTGPVVEIGEPNGTRWGCEYVEKDERCPSGEQWWAAVEEPNGTRWRVTIATRDQGWGNNRPGHLRNHVGLWPLYG